MPSKQWTDSNDDGDADPGEPVKYNVAIANDGSVSLHGLNVTATLASPEGIVCPTLPNGILEPGTTIICSTAYQVR